MTIRPATPADAERIYRLLAECFGSTYLQWTIFRSPRSAAYLGSLLEAPERGGHEIFVSDDGFYDAVRTPDELFLNYIGSLRRGGGNELLRHFEERALELGRGATALDVFASNTVARPWYRRHGYEDVSSVWQAMVNLNSVAKGTPLQYDEAAFAAAREEEERRGFSKIDCGSVEVGLIAGDTLKLLARHGVSPEAAASQVAATFDRACLIVPALGEEPVAWPGARVEQSVRMRKELRR